MYNRYLAPSNLTVTQYAVLVNVGRTGRISRAELADRLGMERTTLTRNLQPLERHKFIRTSTGRDRRQRLLRLTPRGLDRLDSAYPLWQEAQRRFTAEVGAQGVATLRSALATVVRALEPMPRRRHRSDPIGAS